MREQFLNAKADCQWLRDTHLTGAAKHNIRFRSFILYGNEDAPEKIDLYESKDPDYRDLPVYILVQDSEGNLS